MEKTLEIFDVEQATGLLEAVLKESNPREALLLVESHGLWPVGFFEQMLPLLEATTDFSTQEAELKLEIAKLLKETGKLSQDFHDLYVLALVKASEAREQGTTSTEEIPSEQGEKPATIESVVADAVAILNEYPSGKELTEQKASTKEAGLVALQEQIGRLSFDQFNDLREKFGSSFLTMAEMETSAESMRQLFDLTEIILGKDQLELLQNIFVAYQIVYEKTGNKLYFRHSDDRAPYAKLVNYRTIYNNFVDWFMLNRETLPNEERVKYYFVIRNLASVLAKLHIGSQPETSAKILRDKQDIENEEELRGVMTMVAQIEHELVREFKSEDELAVLRKMRKTKERELAGLLVEAEGKVLAQAKSYLNKVLSTYGIIQILDQDIDRAEKQGVSEEASLNTKSDLRTKTLELSWKVMDADIKGREQELGQAKGKAREKLEKRLADLKTRRSAIETMLAATGRRSIYNLKAEGGVQ